MEPEQKANTEPISGADALAIVELLRNDDPQQVAVGLHRLYRGLPATLLCPGEKGMVMGSTIKSAQELFSTLLAVCSQVGASIGIVNAWVNQQPDRSRKGILVPKAYQ